MLRVTLAAGILLQIPSRGGAGLRITACGAFARALSYLFLPFRHSAVATAAALLCWQASVQPLRLAQRREHHGDVARLPACWGRTRYDGGRGVLSYRISDAYFFLVRGTSRHYRNLLQFLRAFLV